MREEAIVDATKFILGAFPKMDVIRQMPADVVAIYRESPHLHRPYNQDEFLAAWGMAICACLSTTPDGLAARGAYMRLHQRCPQCHSDAVNVTIGDVVAVDWATHEDQSEAECGICTWKGVVHHLMPADEE